MWPFKSKPKTELELFYEQLKWLRKQAASGISNYNFDAKRQLEKMNEVIIDAAKPLMNKSINSRFKAIEDAIGDLYLTSAGTDKKE